MSEQRVPRSPRAYVQWLSGQVGPNGLKPVMVLLGVASLERFGNAAIGILGPNIRDTFHISNQTLITTSSLAAILPALLSPWVGYISDRLDRVRLAQYGTAAVGIVAVATGFAPKFWVFAIFVLLAGVGLLVNTPTHSSLITDYYPPEALGTTFTFYLFATTAIGILAGPIAGGLGQISGWRPTFVILAIPTLIGVWVLGKLKDPGRGASLGMVFEHEERSNFWEGYRRVAAVRSLRRTWWAAAFFGGGFVAFISLSNVFFRDVYHYGAAARGFITTGVFGVGGLIGTIIGGRYVQKSLRASHPEFLPVINGLMVVEFGVGMVLMGLMPSAPLSIAMLFVLAIGAAGFNPAYNAMIGLVTTPRLRGQAYSYSLIWVTIGAIFVAPIIGGIANHHERAATYVLGALMMMAGLVELTARQFVARDVKQAQALQTAQDVDAFLAVRGLEVAYGNLQILFGVDLDVQEGEVIALLGTNGAGKSTFLKAISGLLDPIGGAVFFRGRDVSHADAVNKAMLGMALVPGDRGVFPGLTVRENLRIAGWMIKGTGEMDESIERVLGYFPVLRERSDVPAGNMSGGEQQMLVIGQALMSRPKMMMIDELSLGLAPVIVEQLLQTVKRLADDGMTIILVEQSVNIALSIAERAVFMEKGEIRFSGKTKDLLKRPDVLRSVFLEGAGSAVAKKAATRTVRKVSTNGHREKVLDVIDVSKKFGGVSANSDVSMTLYEGEILGILGPNGAGKTTLFDLISGFFPVDEGRIVFDGIDVTELPPDARARLGLGRSFQDSKLFPALTVYETIKVALERHLEVRDPVAAAISLPAVLDSEAAASERVEELIEMLGLQAFRNKFISEISTGSRRMVDLACILAHEPRVILFDEPSSGIAQRESEALGPLLRKVRDLTGASLLVIEHDMPLLTALADEVVALDLGRVVTRGKPHDVVNDPHVVAAYLGADTVAAARSGALPGARNGHRSKGRRASPASKRRSSR